MSLKDFLLVCNDAREHLSELPDVREHLMGSTMQKKWNPFEELDFELSALQTELRQELYSPLAFFFRALLMSADSGVAFLCKNVLKLQTELKSIYFRYPLLVWVAMRHAPHIAALYLYSDFIYYVAGELPVDSPWKLCPRLLSETTTAPAYTQHPRGRCQLKYLWNKKILYLPGEEADPLHIKIQTHVFGREPIQLQHEGDLPGQLELLLVVCPFVKNRERLAANLKRKRLASNYYLLRYVPDFTCYRVKEYLTTPESLANFLVFLADGQTDCQAYMSSLLIRGLLACAEVFHFVKRSSDSAGQSILQLALYWRVKMLADLYFGTQFNVQRIHVTQTEVNSNPRGAVFLLEQLCHRWSEIEKKKQDANRLLLKILGVVGIEESLELSPALRPVLEELTGGLPDLEGASVRYLACYWYAISNKLDSEVCGKHLMYLANEPQRLSGLLLRIHRELINFCPGHVPNASFYSALLSSEAATEESLLADAVSHDSPILFSRLIGELRISPKSADPLDLVMCNNSRSYLSSVSQ